MSMHGTRLERLAAAIATGEMSTGTDAEAAWGRHEDSDEKFAEFVVKRARALEAALDEAEGMERTTEEEIEAMRSRIRQDERTIAAGAEVLTELARILGARPGESLPDAARRVANGSGEPRETAVDHLLRCGFPERSDVPTKGGRSLFVALVEASDLVACPGCHIVLKDRSGEWPRRVSFEPLGFTLSRSGWDGEIESEARAAGLGHRLHFA